MSELRKDVETMLHKVEMSQISLSDIIHDAKSCREDVSFLEEKYKEMNNLEKALRKFLNWLNKAESKESNHETNI